MELRNIKSFLSWGWGAFLLPTRKKKKRLLLIVQWRMWELRLPRHGKRRQAKFQRSHNMERTASAVIQGPAHSEQASFPGPGGTSGSGHDGSDEQIFRGGGSRSSCAHSFSEYLFGQVSKRELKAAKISILLQAQSSIRTGGGLCPKTDEA